MDLASIGKWLLGIGLGLAVLGAALWLAGEFGLPIGRLPGDIRLEGRGWSVYFPVATCIVISLVLTIVVNVLARIFRA